MLVANILFAGIAAASALPQTAPAPSLYNTTYQHVSLSDGTQVPYTIPGPLKGLYFNMSAVTGYSTPNLGHTVGVYPQYVYSFWRSGGFHATNGSYGSLDAAYTNSTTDHFALFSFLAGCNAYYTISSGGTNYELPYPVNCTIHARAYSKFSPRTPIATKDFLYVPQSSQDAYGTPGGTAPVQNFTLPASFAGLSEVRFTATLNKAPSVQGYEPSKGVDVLFDGATFSVSKLRTL